MNPVAVVTIGVFDGMHPGHRAVVSRAGEQALAQGARLVVYSFATHPQVVLGHQGSPPLLTTTGEKVRLLVEAGAQEVRMLQFNSRLRDKGPRRFLREHVFPHYRLVRLVVGYDFAMGRGRAGSLPVLGELGREYGFEVEKVGPLALDGEAVSSTRIREALGMGRVEDANRLLGREYVVSGAVVRGEGRGAGLGFPTANVEIPGDKLYPGRGVYAARVWVGRTGEGPHPAVVNIGMRPTVGGRGETLEAHIIGFEGDLRGRHLSVAFVGRLRDERKFMNVNALAAQIRADIEAGLQLLGREPDPSPR